MPSGRKRTHKEFIQLLNKRPFGENIILLSEYKTEKQKIKCQCRICGFVWITTPKTLLSGIGCKACNNIEVFSGYNDLATIDPVIAAEWDYDNNTSTPDQVLAGSKQKAHWICKNGHRWSAVIYDRHTKHTKCPYCSGNLPIPGETDLATLRPDVVAGWNYKKNTNINPSDCTEKSSKKVWWICEFGHEWQAPVYSRTNGIGCPKCARELQTSFPEQALLFYIKKADPSTIDQHKVGKYLTDVFIPSLRTVIEYDGVQWHKNKLDKDNEKDNYLKTQGYKVVRIREDGLEETDNAINIFYTPKAGGNDNLDSAIKKCLFAIGADHIVKMVNTNSDYDSIIKQLITQKKNRSLEKECPGILSFWDYEHNEPVLPSMVSYGSRLLVYWKCPVCGYQFRRDVHSMARLKTCPVCTKKNGLVKQGFNDLLTYSPELSYEWNYEKNTISPSDIAYNDSSKKIWWKCEQGHEWQARVVDRVKGTNCPYCKNKKVLFGFNDLLTKFPKSSTLWDYDKNSVSPDTVLYSSKKDYYWVCNNGHSFFKSPYRIIRGEECPYCVSRKIKSDFNSLAVKNPELSAEWNYEKNLNLTPEMVMPNSMQKVWWKGGCGHEWKASIANRNSRKSGCPFCSGRKILIGFNDLKTQYPSLSSEWDYDKNGDLSPSDVTPGSSKKVWWICEKGHEWEATINKRTAGRECPYCKKTKKQTKE